MKNNNLIKIAIRAAIEAGHKILDVYNTDFDVELKEDKSPLTIADKKSHKCIDSYLQKTPYPILSEEGRAIPYKERKNWQTFWVVDPLDGTKEFVKRNGEFTVNIALVEKGNPILGVIYVPVQKTLYFASIKNGAFKNDFCDNSNVKNIDNIIKQSTQIPIFDTKSSFTVIGSRSHMSTETEEFVNKLKKKHSKIEVLSAGSSLKLCLVAEGKANVYPRFAPTMEWDTAAGQAICQAAGFNVINHETKKPLIYNKQNLLNPWFVVS